MAFPVAIALGLLDLFKMVFAKKAKVNAAVEWLEQVGMNIAAVKDVRRKIDESADRSAAGQPEELVLTVEEVKVLDYLFDNLSGLLHKIGEKLPS